MATGAYSEASDLMLGAGTLYFERFAKGTYSGELHHMGNCDEFNVTNDTTKVEKNSSMNRERELMASIITAVKPSASLTMTEYDPTNMALGLFGEEGVLTQAAKTVSSEIHTCKPDSILRLVDAKGDPYYNVDNVVIAPVTAIPASVGAVSKLTTLGSDGVMTTSGTYTGLADATYYIRVKTANTAAGDVAGLELEYATSLIGPYTAITAMTAGSSGTKLVAAGVSVVVTLTALQNMVVNEIYKYDCIASKNTFTEEIDYVLDPIELRAGMIKIPSTTNIPVGNVAVSYEVPAGTYPKVSGGNAGKIMGRLVFIGDPNNGACYNAEFWKCSVTPDGDLTGLIGTDFGSFKLKLDILSDRKNHPSDPYYRYARVADN